MVLLFIAIGVLGLILTLILFKIVKPRIMSFS